MSYGFGPVSGTPAAMPRLARWNWKWQPVVTLIVSGKPKVRLSRPLRLIGVLTCSSTTGITPVRKFAGAPSWNAHQPADRLLNHTVVSLVSAGITTDEKPCA